MTALLLDWMTRNRIIFDFGTKSRNEKKKHKNKNKNEVCTSVILALMNLTLKLPQFDSEKPNHELGRKKKKQTKRVYYYSCNDELVINDCFGMQKYMIMGQVGKRAGFRIATIGYFMHEMWI